MATGLVGRLNRRLILEVILGAAAIGLAWLTFTLWSEAEESERLALSCQRASQSMFEMRESERRERERITRLYRHHGGWRLILSKTLPKRAIGVGFSSDGRFVLARLAPSSQQVLVWEIRSGKEADSDGQKPADGIEAVSADGRFVASVEGFELEVREVIDSANQLE